MFLLFVFDMKSPTTIDIFDLYKHRKDRYPFSSDDFVRLVRPSTLNDLLKISGSGNFRC